MSGIIIQSFSILLMWKHRAKAITPISHNIIADSDLENNIQRITVHDAAALSTHELHDRIYCGSYSWKFRFWEPTFSLCITYFKFRCSRFTKKTCNHTMKTIWKKIGWAEKKTFPAEMRTKVNTSWWIMARLAFGLKWDCSLNQR